MNKSKIDFLTHLRNHFFTGIFFLLPLVGTIIIVRFIVVKVNDALLEPILYLIKPTVAWADVRYLILAVKIILFLAILLAISLLGLLIKNLFIRQLFGFGEGLLLKLPIVNKIYLLLQQLIGTFLNKKSDVFNKVLLVEYPRKGIYIIGLYTSKTEGSITQYLPPGCVNVFIPTTPNPTSGFLIMVPQTDVQELDISVEEAMKMVVSGGVVTPREKF